MCLQDFLSHVDANDIKKLWLNVKAVLRGAITWKKIKEHVPAVQLIVSTTSCDADFKAGIMHSCALSSEQLRDLTTDTSAQLVAQCKRQKVRALSFAAKFYPQVKAYLMPLLPANVALHVHSAVGVEAVKSAAYWSDPRVETIAFRYHSLFQLPAKIKQKQYAAQRLPPP